MKLSLQNLTKIFPGRKRKSEPDVAAVSDFTFDFPDGKLVALLGPSGCGKSTVLNLISGLLTPTSGRILFDGADVTDIPPEERNIGLVFQNYALYPHLTVMQNIMFPLQNIRVPQRLTKSDMLDKVREAAKVVEVSDLLDRRPSELSGGQQQRVAIARAIVKSPRILLLDEPLSNLDARLRLQMREELRRIQQNINITTIFVTHDQEDAMSVSDLIAVMRDGRIEQTGEPQEVYDSPCSLFVSKFLGTPQINVFLGRIDEGKLYIGDDAVLSISGAEPQDVYAGIRPEGFTVSDSGQLRCKLDRVEVLGRDFSILSSNDASVNAVVRSIINTDAFISQQQPAQQSGSVKFTLRPNKVHLFNRTTEMRVNCSALAITDR